MMWLVAIAVATVGALIVEMILHHRAESRWQKMFAARMELPPLDEPQPQAAVPAPMTDGKRRVMVRVPGTEMFKKVSR